MKCHEILEWLETIMPLELAMDWDNPGLLVGSKEKEVKKILIGLDVTSEMLDEAIKSNVDLIITHHPMIFSSVKKVVADDFIGKRIIRMIKNDISYIAMHTNYDVAPGCMADNAANLLNIKGNPLEVTGEYNAQEIGIGKTGVLTEPMKLYDLIAYVKEKFNLPYLVVYGNPDYNQKFSKIAISPGSGKSMKKFAIENHAQVLITGDITHHEGLDAIEDGLIILDAGHFGLEHIFINDIKDKLENQYSNKLEIHTFKCEYPTQIK